MPTYQIAAPDGKTYRIDGPTGASQDEVIAAILAQNPMAGTPPPETTVMGNVKEFAKGVVPGAVGLVESAAVGASALLPSDMEKGARQGINSVASAIKAPFAADPGYEESVGRKLGEGLGSTAPFLLMGPAGIPGVVGAAGLAVGSGAGTARMRAEKEGATPEQISDATAWGTIPGALEMISPARILQRIPGANLAGIVEKARRMVLAGGEEAAQEAVSAWAQNMIAKGVYKPDQALIEGVGEDAAYGGAVGALLQGVMDLAIGRQRGGGTGSGSSLPPGDDPITVAKRNAAAQAAAAAQTTTPTTPTAAAPTGTVPPAPAAPATATAPAGTPTPPTPTVAQPTVRPAATKAPATPTVTPAAAVEETPTPEATEPAQPNGVLTPDLLKSLGIPKNASVSKRLSGMDYNNPEQRDEIEDTLRGYAKTTKSEEARQKLTEFADNVLPARTPRDATGSNEGTSGTSVSVASEAATDDAPTNDTTRSEPNGVVPAAENAGGTAGGEKPSYSPVGETIAALKKEWMEAVNRNEDNATLAAINSRIVELTAAQKRGDIPADAPAKPEVSTAPEEKPTPVEGAPTVEQSTEVSTAPVKQQEAPKPAVETPTAEPTSPITAESLEPKTPKIPKPVKAEEPAAPVVQEAPTAPTVQSLRAERDKLLTPSGKVPAPKSKARIKYDELSTKILEMAREPYHSSVDQPVRQDLDSLELKGLRIEYNAAKDEVERLDKSNTLLMDEWVKANRNVEAVSTGTPEAQALAANNLKETEANLDAGKKQYLAAHKKAEAIYNKIHDEANIEVEAKLGDKYLEDTKEQKLKAETDRLLNRTPPRTSYPFNAESYEAVVEAIDEELPHSTPEYKDFIEKYFEPSDKKGGAPRKLRGKYAEADVVAAGKKLLHKMVLLKDPKAHKDEALIADIREGGLKKALQRIATESRYPYQKRAARRMLELSEKYGLPEVMFVDKIRDLDGNVLEEASGGYFYQADAIHFIEEFTNARSVLHEALHSYTLSLLYSPEGQLSKEYGVVKKLYDYLRYKNPESLEGVYAMTSLDEFIPEVLSNPLLQERLQKINFEGQTIWRRLVEAFRTLLGLPTPQNNETLDALFMAAETSLRMLEPGAKAQAEVNSREQGPTKGATPEVAQARAAGVPIVEKRERPNRRESIRRKLGEHSVEGFRVKTVDSMAALAARFSEMYLGRRVSAGGDINPEIEYSAARDSARYAKAAKRTGTIIDDTDGMATAGTLVAQQFTNARGDVELNLINGEEVSYEKALGIIANSATLTQERADEILIGHRDYNIRQEFRAAGIPFNSHLHDWEIDALENEYQNNTEVQRVSQMLDAVRYSMIDRMVTSGRWTPEKAEDMKATVGYIPYSRLDELDGEYAKHSGRTGPGLSSNWKKYIGSADRPTTSPLENYSGLIDWFVKESMLNKSRTRALQELELFQYAENMSLPGKEIRSNMQPAIVDTYVDGVKTKFFVPDPALLGAFVFPNPHVSDTVKFMQGASRVLRAGVTSTPPFVIKQVIDDITRMYSYAGMKNNMKAFRRVAFNFPRFWFDEIMDRKSSLAKELENYGLVGTFDFHATSDVRDIMSEAGLEKKNLGSRILQIMEAGAKASDLAVRAALFEQIKEETGSTVEAANAAREIINFSRRGNAVILDTMIRTVPFFNAFARGTDKLLMAATGGKGGYGGSVGQVQGVFWKRMSVLAAMGTVYALMMSDDDEYNSLPDNVRDRGIVIPLGKEFKEKTGSIPYVPLPADLALIFKAIPERMVQYIRSYGTPEERTMMDITRELMKQGYNIFSSPNITPQMLRPILENMVNYSFFLDRPLESQMQIANYKPYLRTTTNTSEMAKWLAGKGEEWSVQSGTDIINVSPIKIDNFIRGFLGSIGGMTISMSDALLNPNKTDRPMHQQLASSLTGASAFLRDGLSTKHMDELYRMERSVEQAAKSYDLISKKDPTAASKLMYDNYDLIAVRSAVKSTMENVRRINANIRAADEMVSLSPSERRDIINSLRVQANIVASQIPDIRRTVNGIRESLQ